MNALAGLVLDDGDAVAILNVATRYPWHSHPGLPDVLGYLDGAEVRPAASEWQVGHYVAIVGSLTGSHRQLLMCVDTYPSLGAQGSICSRPNAWPRRSTAMAPRPRAGSSWPSPPTDRPGSRAWAANQALAFGYWDNGAPMSAS